MTDVMVPIMIGEAVCPDPPEGCGMHWPVALGHQIGSCGACGKVPTLVPKDKYDTIMVRTNEMRSVPRAKR